MANCSSGYGIEQLKKQCYDEWMSVEAKHIVDLKEALMCHQRSYDDHKLEELVGEIVNDFQRYVKKRSELCGRCSSSYLAPSWNSSLENGLLWIGGCRPSSFFRVIYALCGSQAESQHTHYLLKIDDGSMSDLTSSQLAKVNELHMNVIREEDKITKKAANSQEDAADMPIAVTAYATDSVEAGVAVEDALDKHERSMAVLIAEADEIRLETLRMIVETLTPVQAAEFLLAGKRLHVSLHEWGRGREECCLGRARAEDVDVTRSGHTS